MMTRPACSSMKTVFSGLSSRQLGSAAAHKLVEINEQRAAIDQNRLRDNGAICDLGNTEYQESGYLYIATAHAAHRATTRAGDNDGRSLLTLHLLEFLHGFLERCLGGVTKISGSLSQ